jgi:hypothetical protein
LGMAHRLSDSIYWFSFLISIVCKGFDKKKR